MTFHFTISRFLIIAINLFVVSLGLPRFGFGFAETATHGYLSCSTCHYSSSGRGLLTPYGKTIANELYSYWKTENENEALETETPWWRLGGQVRLLQFVQDTPVYQKARFFPMQAEIEGAIDKETWAIVGSAGAWRPLDTADKKLRGYSRNHYLVYRPSENWNLRLGHFRLSHGLGIPDHTTLTNEGLGWTHSHETYNVEVSYFNENNVLQGTWIVPSKLLVTDELIHGGSINFQRLLASENRLGLNVSRFERSGVSETQLNLHSVLKISELSFLQLELAQRAILTNPQVEQQALFSRYSHQIAFGLRPLLQFEAANLDKTANLKAQRYYVGTEWFPLAMADALVLLGRETQNGKDDQLIFNAIGHFYF